MSDDVRIRQLVERAIESDLSPEEACANAPGLLDAVRAKLAHMRRVERELDRIFPSLDSPLPDDAVALPKIAGYDVESVLGRGGMGIVFKARHRDLKRTVALKMMLAGTFAGPQQRARFRREAEAIAALKHPNVVQVYDVGESGGLPYFTMELVEGGSLADRLAGRPRPTREAAELVATLASAVHAAHGAGLVHRDLKPSNVLLTSDGVPKISDFGLARRVESDATLTASGARLGTPSYMAPEQAKGNADAIGPAADVWSLGAILYESLTGRPPFVGATAAETEAQLLHDEPLAPSRLNRVVPRDLETIVLQCLQKEPGRRYASAEALAEDLRRFARGEPVAARRTGRVERAFKWARRRPAQALVGALSVLFIAAIAGGGLWFRFDRSAALRAADEALQEVAKRESTSDWSEARHALERATLHLSSRDAPDLSARIEIARRDLDLVDRLAAIRLARAASDRGDFDRNRIARSYREAFAQAGYEIPADGIDLASGAAAGKRIAQSAVKRALVGALDDWTICVSDRAEIQRLLITARAADPDPRWRDPLRTPHLWSDPKVLDQLERDVDVANETVTVLNVFGFVLEHFGRDDVPLRRQIQRAHVDDFWANFHLAESLDQRGDADAVGYYRAAVSLQPLAVAGHANLGCALLHQGRNDDAIACWKRAVELDPDCAIAHINLAIQSYERGDLEETESHARRALRSDPDLPLAHALLGEALLRRGKLAEAEPLLVRAVELCTPKHGEKAPSCRPQVEHTLRWCQKLIATERRMPDFVAGRAQPEDADEARAAAQLALQRKWYLPAAEFDAIALEKEPALADDLAGDTRHEAARAALLAGSEQDESGLELDDDARAAWRTRALEWLRADVSAFRDALAKSNSANDARLREDLANWRIDPGLEAIRASEALDALAPEERERWTSLWKDVDALIGPAKQEK
jgi:serine/threonine-protein kinase